VFADERDYVTVSLTGEAVVLAVVVDGKAGRIIVSRMEGTEGLFAPEFKPIVGFEEGLKRDTGFDLFD
jgi:hypothetical protein